MQEIARAAPSAMRPPAATQQVFSTLNGTMRGAPQTSSVIRHATLLFPGWYFSNSYLAVIQPS